MNRIQDMPAAERLRRARSILVTSSPFFGCLALSLKIEEAPGKTETMAVDGIHLFYAAPYVESLTEPELLGVMVHEMLHLARLHHVRRGGRDLADWNAACDFTINPDVEKAGFTLPRDVLRSAEFDGQGAESVYAELQRRKPKQQPEADDSDDQEADDDGEEGDESAPGTGDDQEGEESGPDADGDDDGDGDDSAAGGPSQGDGDGNGKGAPAPDPGRCGGVIDPEPEAGTLADLAADIEARVRQAVSVAKAANAGQIPGFLERLVEELNEPRISWREALAAFVDDAATRTLSWNRPNKRFLGGPFYMPGSEADSVRKVVAVVDTSGSIDAPTLSAFRDELQGMLDSGRVESVAVVYCHERVHGEAEFTAGDIVRLEVTETAGTAFGPAFRHIEAEHADAAAVVYLTDLEPFGPDAWGTEPAAPVLWAVIGRQRAAPFGTVLPIDPHA